MDVFNCLLLTVLVVIGLLINHRMTGIAQGLRNLHVMLEREGRAICTRLDKLGDVPHCSPFPEPPPVDDEVNEILRAKPIPPPKKKPAGMR